MPGGNTISHVDVGPMLLASSRQGRLTVVPSTEMSRRACGSPSTISCTADGSAVASSGWDDALNVSVSTFEKLSKAGVSVKSAGSAGLSASEYEMDTRPASAPLSVTANVNPVKPTLMFS